MMIKPSDVKIGDKLYVNSSFYIEHGLDDICGGLATVKSISENLNRPLSNQYMITVEEIRSSRHFNLWYLLNNQEEFKIKYAGKLVHECPDTR